jgi:hypothetical protein
VCGVVKESPEFARMRQLASRQPSRDLLRTHAVHVLVGDRVPPRYLLRLGVALLLVFAYPF